MCTLEGTLYAGRSQADLLVCVSQRQININHPNPLHLYVCLGEVEHICCLICAASPRRETNYNWSCACSGPLDLDTKVDWIVDDVLQEVQLLRAQER